MIFRKINKKHLKILALILVIFLLGVGFGNFFNGEKSTQEVRLSPNKDFLNEVYGKVKENYWDNISDPQLIDLFRLASQKEGLILPARIEGKESLISQILNSNPDDKKIANIVGTVLASLQPTGRSGLYTEKQEVALKNTVSNINPEKDLYGDLGVTKGASQEAVEKAFKEKEQNLKADGSPAAQEKLKKITYAKEVLTEDAQKQNYDAGGIEPTIFTEVISPGILYMQFKKFSPTSYEEFIKAFESHKDTNLNSLIFDLRGNVGGAIDATSYFLGHFLGKDQYAFDFYHKGGYEPFKTPTEKLPTISKFKQVVVLVDQNTQSSAEMMAAALKRYHIGVVVGVPTKGWGTVERVFPLDNQISQDEKYSLFLVHSITLRDDNLPIEGRGVEPNINITSSSWQDQLFSYFRNQVLINTVKDVL